MSWFYFVFPNDLIFEIECLVKMSGKWFETFSPSRWKDRWVGSWADRRYWADWFQEITLPPWIAGRRHRSRVTHHFHRSRWPNDFHRTPKKHEIPFSVLVVREDGRVWKLRPGTIPTWCCERIGWTVACMSGTPTWRGTSWPDSRNKRRGRNRVVICPFGDSCKWRIHRGRNSSVGVGDRNFRREWQVHHSPSGHSQQVDRQVDRQLKGWTWDLPFQLIHRRLLRHQPVRRYPPCWKRDSDFHWPTRRWSLIDRLTCWIFDNRQSRQ